ncbi:hypothetical protein ANN_21438 [Periplaneta americana]|uniref:DUF4817 domain-containing protein n=1 Tax=Periplaneta americana TaxID=6978 RepID=A0ABQ8SG16_PERAM|nr:hypothetical protein ANN_21438 [Periplaneta americana]
MCNVSTTVDLSSSVTCTCVPSLPSKETLRGHSDSSFRGEGYIQCCVGVRLCDMYSNQELAEIHFMYGKADGNAELARRLYQERYPQPQCPDRKIFALSPADYPARVRFCQWILQQCGVNPNFPALILFTDEAQFTVQISSAYGRMKTHVQLFHLITRGREYRNKFRRLQNKPTNQDSEFMTSFIYATRNDCMDVYNEEVITRQRIFVPKRIADRVVSSGSYIYYVTWMRKQGRIASRDRPIPAFGQIIIIIIIIIIITTIIIHTCEVTVRASGRKIRMDPKVVVQMVVREFGTSDAKPSVVFFRMFHQLKNELKYEQEAVETYTSPLLMKYQI